MTGQPLSEATRQALQSSSTATIANVLLKYGLNNVCLSDISPLSDKQPSVVGPVYTLRFIPSRPDLDNMENYSRSDNIHRRAIEECPAGYVLVIDAMGVLTASSAGDMMAARLKTRGVVAMVTDGGFRDTSGIIEAGLPAFHRQPALPATPVALHPVELNAPIGCAGVAVYPQDIIVGDNNGVVVIPYSLAEKIATEALEASQYEEYARLQIKQGKSIFGLFPSTRGSLQEYEAWKATGKPDNP